LALGIWYESEGGPGGHFFPGEFPKETADALEGFLDGPA
jgi:hypothetical protein